MSDVADSVLSVFQGRITNARVTVERGFRAAAPIRIFEGEIRQVISNLIGNAIDAMPRGGRLLVRLRQGTNWSTGERGVVVTLADSGEGMTKQTLARLFDPFFTTKGLTGTGLGLWVSKEIVDRHNGSLLVRSSQSPRHRGTVFTLFLPFNAIMRQ